MTCKGRELADMMERRRLGILCVLGTKLIKNLPEDAPLKGRQKGDERGTRGWSKVAGSIVLSCLSFPEA